MPGADHSPGEFDLISQYLSDFDRGPSVALGVGDDAALLKLVTGEVLAVSTDAAIEGRHFPVGAPADRIAYRSVAAAASDLAAMGARPLGFTLSLTVPEADEAWFSTLREGLADASQSFALPLVGGDLTRGPLALVITVFGGVIDGKALQRDGAKVDDVLYVDRTLGDAAMGLQVLTSELALEDEAAEAALQRFWRPMPALVLGVSLAGVATAAIDLSDGLLADLEHVAKASGVAIHVHIDQLPLSGVLNSAFNREEALSLALSGGEDFALCFTLPPQVQAPAGCIAIGDVRAGSGVHCGAQPAETGYRHF
ncbi:MAG: thiamine-phosphate kinase [Pseudomonadota bacterium]